MPVSKTKFRASVARGIDKSSLTAENKAAHILAGFSVISIGEAIGHDMEIDDTTLNQVVEHGNKSKNGVKSRFGHPDMSSDALGTYLGRAKNFRKDGDRVRADLHLDESSFDTPNGDLGGYVSQLAESDPDAFGVSIVFKGKTEQRLNEDGTRQRDEAGNALLPLARVEYLYAVDAVDDPATGDGMFSQSVGLSASVSSQLDRFLDDEESVEHGVAYLKRFAGNRELSVDDPRMGKLCAIMDAFRSQFKQEETAMPAEKPEVAAVATQTPATEQIDKSALRKAERARIDTIRKLGARMGIEGKVIEDAVDGDLSIEEVASKFSRIETSSLTPVAPGAEHPTVQVAKDETDKFRAGHVNAFAVRTGMDSTPAALDANRRSEFRGATLLSLARECLSRAGLQGIVRMPAEDVYAAIIRQTRFGGGMSQQTDDFTNILGATLNKSLVRGWDAAPVTYPRWCAQGSLSDFKTADLAKLSDFSDVEEIPEGQSPKEGTFSDTKETAKLSTWGKFFTLTRQALINDDLNAFTRIPASMTGSLRRKMNKLAYGMLFNGNGVNANFAGPTMLEDSVALFNLASHANVGTAGAISKTTLDEAFVAFANQTLPSPDGGRSAAIRTNIRPRYMLCGNRNEMLAAQTFSSALLAITADAVTAGTDLVNIYGPGRPRNLDIIVDAEIDNLSATKTAPWWLAADPVQLGTITLYTLNGASAPYTASAPSEIGEADGMKWYVRHDFVFAAEDFRGLFVNQGA